MRSSQGQFVIGALALALLTVTCLLLQRDDAQVEVQLPQETPQVADLSVLDKLLDRYEDLARNMTRRISVAEQALLQFQQRQSLRSSAGMSIPGRIAAPFSPDQHPQDNAGTASGEAPGSGEEEQPDIEEGNVEEEAGETDAERQERTAAEIKEQRQLIDFDPIANTFKRFRPDFKCGDRVPPLPDWEPVECDPASESPCCSSLGWCGKSRLHCKCDKCADYTDRVELQFNALKATGKGHECAEIAYSFGEQPSPEACAMLTIKQTECGRMLMYSWEYRVWGCNCCTAGTGPSEESKPEWTVYTISVKAKPVAPRISFKR